MMDSKPATINDVARAAGVSYQTVSRVINDHPSVREDTRRRVKEVIRRLKYQPSSVARSLATRRSNLIGVVSFGSPEFGPTQMLYNIEQAAQMRGYHVSISSIPALSREELGLAVNALRRQRVDGILIIAPLLGAETGFLREFAVPIVLVDADPSAGLPISSIDQFYGGRMGVEHLLGLGHRRLALIGGPQQWNNARQRQQGWKDTLLGAGLRPVAQVFGDWSAKSGYAAAQALLEVGEPFTGLLVGNDQMALGALRALREAGLAVPGEVSVVGFDNIPESEFFDPPLTTVYQDFPSLGQGSLAQLLALIEAPAEAGAAQVIEPKLVVRASTGVAHSPKGGAIVRPSSLSQGPRGAKPRKWRKGDE